MQPVFDSLLRHRYGIVLDIGANIGAHSVYLGQHRTVWAFEPQRTTFDILQTNVKNNCREGSVECFNFGLSDKTGNAQMMKADPRNIAATGIGTGGEVISVRQLDSVWNEHGRPKIAFVKIDVEGHEVQVFKGGVECLKNIPILFEDHTGEATKYLVKLGYRIAENRFFLSQNDYIAWPQNVDPPDAFRKILPPL